MSDAPLPERLAALDACAVSDALDAHGLPGAVAEKIVPLSVPRRIAGRVITVELGPADGRRAVRHLGAAAVDAAGKGDVIVVAHRGELAVSGWGGLLSLGASRRGVEGVIVDGACRDLDEAVELDFPVYARTGVPITARRRVIEVAWNEPVVVAGVDVAPGDLVIADRSGVVFVPRSDADAIVAAAEDIVRRERAMADAVQSGMPISEVLAGGYEQLLERGRES